MVLVTAVSGYFMGLIQLDRLHGESKVEATRVDEVAVPGGGRVVVPVPDSAGIHPIVEYAKLGVSGPRPNGAWRSSMTTLTSRKDGGGGGSGTVAAGPVSDAERRKAIERRAERRAFDGAPPVVPHPVDAISSANCRICHLTGLVIREVTAPRMSHPEMGNCTQCHVPQQGLAIPAEEVGETPRFVNDFVGRVSAGRGTRAWPGAPPTVPHSFWMRQDCVSCHGPTGLPGLRTSHAERQLCTQCHVPEGGFDLLNEAPAILAGSPAQTALNASR